MPSLNERLLRIFEELENGLIFSSQAIGNEITCILIDIIRALEEKTNKHYPVKISNDNVLVFYIVNFIDKNATNIKISISIKYSFQVMDPRHKRSEHH